MAETYHTEFRVEGPCSNRQGYFYIVDSETGKDVPGMRYVHYATAQKRKDEMNDAYAQGLARNT